MARRVKHGPVHIQRAATFPSRLRVADNRIFDENAYDITTDQPMRGFNVHTVPFSQGDYNTMAALGANFQRAVCHWDNFEITQGVIDSTGLTDYLDVMVARAKAAGIYTLLEVHLNVGRIPSWVNQATGTEWDWFIRDGQTLTQTFATRYASEKAVIGISINEPPTVFWSSIMTGFETIVPWYTSLATTWPVFFSGGYAQQSWLPSGTGGGGIVDLDVARMLALDVNKRGLVYDFHDYYVGPTGASPVYQSNGMIWPSTQGGTAIFGGTYPDTSQARTDHIAFLAPQKALKDSNSRIALMMGEFSGGDMSTTAASVTAERHFIADKITHFRSAGAVIECWWNYDNATIATNAFSARPSSTTRTSIATDWYGNVTAPA